MPREKLYYYLNNLSIEEIKNLLDEELTKVSSWKEICKFKDLCNELYILKH